MPKIAPLEERLPEILNCWKIDSHNYESILQSFFDDLKINLGDGNLYFRQRVKSIKRLEAKIVHKFQKIEENKKYKDISKNNYKEKVTDLLGIRILYIFRHEFEKIHSFLTNMKSEFEVTERIVYLKGDQKNTYQSYYEKLGFLRIDTDKKQYTLVHYVIRTKGQVFIEIQVRTLAEENYAQVEHDARYIDSNKNLENDEQLSNLLNGLSNSASTLNAIVITVSDFIDNIEKIKTQDVEIKEYKSEILKWKNENNKPSTNYVLQVPNTGISSVQFLNQTDKNMLKTVGESLSTFFKTLPK